MGYFVIPTLNNGSLRVHWWRGTDEHVCIVLSTDFVRTVRSAVARFPSFAAVVEEVSVLGGKGSVAAIIVRIVC